MSAITCPRCGATVIIPGQGRTVSLGQEWGPPHRGFFPAGVVSFRRDCAALQGRLFACLGCGLCWSTIEPRAVRAVMTRRHSPVAREHLDALDRGRPGHPAPAGPDRPDITLLAALNKLVLAGEGPTALRRHFRAATGGSRLGALVATWNWAGLSYAQRLARCRRAMKKPAPDDRAEPI